MSRIAVVVCVAGIALAAAPSAQAWPSPPRDLPFSHVCVPNRALSPALRAAGDLADKGSGRSLRWRNLPCIKKVRYIIRSPEQINVAASMGVLWCIVVNSKPGSPFGTVLSMGAASHWCGRKHRFWLYVQYR